MPPSCGHEQRGARLPPPARPTSPALTLPCLRADLLGTLKGVEGRRQGRAVFCRGTESALLPCPSTLLQRTHTHTLPM